MERVNEPFSNNAPQLAPYELPTMAAMSKNGA